MFFQYKFGINCNQFLGSHCNAQELQVHFLQRNFHLAFEYVQTSQENAQRTMYCRNGQK